ncbi:MULTISPECIES: type IV secretory system conjugative DNA transfer family protein [unclassified Streptomyces]|uniref:type IV secretory system conjugative DNA transfer family protein n=1 Tax=unclassified Streptomyces TaxID=2593676 RepID=UPI001660D82C|nr:MULTISPECIES: type IV secretory system conjugative DNA transfer family protein [unclassified Streptomyces]MBD0712487.1 type VI secretion protein [Streptomyces sp. CBMA291]MBD0716861.1 type VI secretion protein [Streptomyces sp. CBMA370]
MEPVRKGGGVSDGLLLSLFGLLLGLTVLVWTATGLAGLFSHGAWPDGLGFTGTPSALRSLATAPTDLPAAWPTTPPEQLSGYGLFWGLLIGEAMILLVLAVFALGTLARWRAVRASRKQGAYAPHPTRNPARTPAPEPADPLRKSPKAPHGSPEAILGHPVRDPRHPLGTTPPPVRETPEPSPDHPTPLGATPTPAPHSAPAPHSTPGPTPTPEATPTPPPTPAPTPSLPIPLPSPSPPATPAALPARTLYGPPEARHPAAVQAVLDAEGAALVVTSDPALWSTTKDARAKLGPVLVHDPGHLCDTPARLHWSPSEHCEDPAVAQQRAVALLAPVRPHARLDAATAETAETLLRCWLHAAAVDGRPFRQVHRWAQGTGAHEPVRILRSHPKAASGHAGLLEAALTAHPESRRLAQQLTARALAALSSVHIRNAYTAHRADSLSLTSFIPEGGTLYVVGEPIEDPRTRPGGMPLLTALAAHVVELGRRMAARSPAGRLDPPLTLVLDDIAAVAPLPQLPELLASGHEQGLPTLALLRSREQARARWPETTLSH